MNARCVIGAYLAAKERVIAAGFEKEIGWQEQRSIELVTESEFLSEAAWVVVASGLSDVVVRRIFPGLAAAFLWWSSGSSIADSRRRCRRHALNVLAHHGKIDAIVEIACSVATEGFEAIRQGVIHGGAEYLRRFSYIGPATSCHLAKNIGVGTSKPDRHLVRIAAAFRYRSVTHLCTDITEFLGEPAAVVDLVLWRSATLDPGYLQRLLDDYWATAENDTPWGNSLLGAERSAARDSDQ